MGVGELRCGGGDQEIAHQRNLEATGDREAIDCTDDGLVASLHCLAEIAVRDGFLYCYLAAEFLEIETDRECPTGTGENDDLGFGVVR